MKNLRPLLAFTVVLVLVGCQSGKQARVTTPKAVASSEVIYSFDYNFLAYFGPEGVTKIQKAIREAHPNEKIHFIDSASNK